MDRSELENQAKKQLAADRYARSQGFEDAQELEDSKFPLVVRRLLAFGLFLFACYAAYHFIFVMRW